MKHDQKQRLLDIAQNTAAHLEQFGQSLQSTLTHAPEKLDQIRETVGPALDKLHDTLKYIDHKKQESGENAARWAETAQRKSQAVKAALWETPEEPHHSSDKLLWLFIGLGAGALLGLLLAPASGRRSRALVRDQIYKNRKNLARATSNRATDLSNKARGLSHKIQKTMQRNNEEESVTDESLADRVRTRLGQVIEAGMPHLNIECCDGVVTLHGPTVNASLEATIISAVQSIPGVAEVQSKLPVSSDSESDEE
jgi:gas vesicle protein